MNKLVCFTDGGSRGNPGHAAIGVYFLNPDGSRSTHSEYIGVATNNVAEYMALFAAVEDAVRRKMDALQVFSDSEVMVKQIKGQYIVRDEKLRRIYDRIIQMLPQLKEFRIQHVPREKNTEADRLVNEVLDAIPRQNLRKGTRKDSVLRK